MFLLNAFCVSGFKFKVDTLIFIDIDVLQAESEGNGSHANTS